MADLHIVRPHPLGLQAARAIAGNWMEHMQTHYGMACHYTPDALRDTISFERKGVRGTLVVTQNQFELTATLGFLLSAFKAQIEAEITRNLDHLLCGTTGAKPD